MTSSKIQRFDLFKAAMENSDYLVAINKTKATQAQFLTTLYEENLTYQEIIHSIQIVQNSQVKSLLIIYLLSQKEYLDSLKGPSALDRLTTRDHHIPSHLNPLIHQLDLKILTHAMISKLEPEAAVGILCSFPHFHQITKEQVEALLERYPKHEFIMYWMSHFSTMPNAHYMLAHLMTLANTNILTELNQIDTDQKETIILNIIEHFELFHHISQKFLESANKESYLTFAIRLYLHGHYNQTLVTYINQLTNKLLEKNHSFSHAAIELFFFLNDKLAFKELTNKITPLTNRYLRMSAREGDTTLFYQNNQISPQRIVQNMNLNPVASKIPSEAEDYKEYPCINDLVRNKKPINYFEYFLIHYQGDSESINKLLNDYMGYYEHCDDVKSRSQAIRHLGFTLTRPELGTLVKEAIFTAFLNYPSFFDEQIIHYLFLFDAKRVIRYMGLHGKQDNYQKIITLCTLALKNLNSDKNPKIIRVARKALSEAKFELSLTQEKGFFSQIIKWIKRCWTYGWTGLFKPNRPKYVTSESSALEAFSKKLLLNPQKKVISVENSEKDLVILLKKINAPFSQKQFEDIIKALDIYSLQPAHKKEFETRHKLHLVYHDVLSKKEENSMIRHWLKNNQSSFITNQFRLLELIIKKKPLSNLHSLLAQINEDTDQFQYILDELTCVMPEIRVIPSAKVLKTTNLAASTANILSKYTTEASEYAHTAWKWAGCFFNKIGTATQEEEDEDYFIEHVPSFRTSK